MKIVVRNSKLRPVDRGWDIRRPDVVTRPPRSSQTVCRRAGGCNPARNGRLQAVPEQRANPTRAQLPARGGSNNDCATAPGWPGKRRPIAPLAVPLPRPHQAARPHRTAGTLSSRGSHNRCRLGLRAPMHACIQGECAGYARGCRLVPGRSVIAGSHTLTGAWLAPSPSQLPRTAGRREGHAPRSCNNRATTRPK